MLIFLAERNGRKTLTTVQGLPKKFDQKKILKVIKKKFACNGTIVTDAEMGEVVQLQGDQRKDVQDFLTDKKEGLGLEAKTIKVSQVLLVSVDEADELSRSTVSKARYAFPRASASALSFVCCFAASTERDLLRVAFTRKERGRLAVGEWKCKVLGTDVCWAVGGR
jgi:translation initiation factor 1